MDWTGNTKSIYTTLGASNHTDKEREINDYYATDPAAIDYLLAGGAEISHKIWECACGEGHLSKKLIELGYDVQSTDLINRGFGVGGWTSSVFMRFLTVIYSQIRLTSTLKSFANMLCS